MRYVREQYAAVLTVLMVGELAFGGWLVARGLAWWRSAAAQQLAWALGLSEDLRSWLQLFGRWHPLPQHIEELIQVTTHFCLLRKLHRMIASYQFVLSSGISTDYAI